MHLPYHTPAQGTESRGSVGRPGPPVSSFVLDPFGCPVEIPPYNSQKSLATLANIQTNDDSADFGSLSDLCGHFCAWIRSNFLASRAWLGVGFFLSGPLPELVRPSLRKLLTALLQVPLRGVQWCGKYCLYWASWDWGTTALILCLTSTEVPNQSTTRDE